MDLSKWFNWIKLPTKTLSGLCIVFAILLFSSGTPLNNFGLKFLVTKYRAYLGVGS